MPRKKPDAAPAASPEPEKPARTRRSRSTESAKGEPLMVNGKLVQHGEPGHTGK